MPTAKDPETEAKPERGGQREGKLRRGGQRPDTVGCGRGQKTTATGLGPLT